MQRKTSYKGGGKGGPEREEKQQLSKTFSCITYQVMTQFRPSQKLRRNGDQILSLTEDGKVLYIYKAEQKRMVRVPF